MFRDFQEKVESLILNKGFPKPSGPWKEIEIRARGWESYRNPCSGFSVTKSPDGSIRIYREVPYDLTGHCLNRGETDSRLLGVIRSPQS